MEDAEDYELEEQKSYPQYDNMDYSDLQSSFYDLTNRLQRDVRYDSDPLVTTDLNNELSYVKKIMEERGTAQTTFNKGEEEKLPQEYRDMLLRFDETTDRMERDVRKRIEELKANQKTFTEGEGRTVNILGPSGSTTVPGVEFVEDSNNLLPDVLDAFDESFDADWIDVEDRLSKLKKFSTVERKRDFENQVERVQAVTRVIQTKEKLVLNPRNRNVRELIKRSSVKTLKDGTEVLMFRSEQGINKSGTQIMKRGKTSTPVYSKDSPALKEYKELVRKIRENPPDSNVRITSEESVNRSVERIQPSDLNEFSDEEYAERANIQLIDLGENLGNINGLTMQENNELRGVLNPPEGSDLRSRIGPTGALQIQADYFNEAIGETVDRVSDAKGVTEYNAIIERIEGLKEARDRTLKQRALEETKEEQLNDISRLCKFVKWLGKEKVGLIGVAVSAAGLITTLLVHARGAIVGTAKATSSVAKALANLAKKAGPVLVPVLNTIAAALSWGAKGIAWLASNLWVLAVAAALIVYNYYTK
jgi:hypothetical protein